MSSIMHNSEQADAIDKALRKRLVEVERQRDELLAAIKNVEKVKGRYHTEIAWRRLADLAKNIAAARKEQGK